MTVVFLCNLSGMNIQHGYQQVYIDCKDRTAKGHKDFSVVQGQL